METGGGYGGAGSSEVGRGEAEGVPMVLERVTRVGVRGRLKVTHGLVELDGHVH